MNYYCVLGLKYIPTSARQWASTPLNIFLTLGLEFDGIEYTSVNLVHNAPPPRPAASPASSFPHPPKPSSQMQGLSEFIY
jgi:hypothetical protein